MNKLIVLPGFMSCSFFIEELPYLKKIFKDIVVISYDEDFNRCKNICEDFCISFYLIPRRQPINKVMSLVNWLNREEVKKEIKDNVKCSLSGLKKFLYIVHYAVFANLAYEIIEEEIMKTDGQVYIYAFWLSRTAYAASTFKGNSKIKKIVSRAHGYDLYLERNTLAYLPFRKYINENLSTISFISEEGKTYFEKWEATELERCTYSQKKVSYLGCANILNIRKTIVPKKNITIASCSDIVDVKRIDLIIDALAKLKDINIEWIHIGSGEKEKEKEIKGYAFKILTNQVPYKFIGQVEKEEILPLYQKYDVDFLINLSDSEGLPVTIMEAFSFGIPVIARGVGGIPEIVKDSTGLLLSVGMGREDMFQLIKTFILIRQKNIKAYYKFCVACRMQWENHFSAENNYEQFINEILLYEEVAK